MQARLALLLILSLAPACRRTALPAFDPALAFCIPAGTRVLAGVDLDHLRASPLYRNLSPGIAALVEPLRDASLLVLASHGASLTAIARGSFTEPPAGSTLVAPALAILASPETVAAAKAQLRAQTVAAPQLTSYMEPLASNPVWAVALGSATLPLTGNLANLNNFLHATAYTTAVGRIDDRLSLEIKGVCRTADDAIRLERSVRALISLSGISGKSLGEIRLDREDLTVRINVSADAAAAERLLR